MKRFVVSWKSGEDSPANGKIVFLEAWKGAYLAAAPDSKLVLGGRMSDGRAAGDC